LVHSEIPSTITKVLFFGHLLLLGLIILDCFLENDIERKKITIIPFFHSTFIIKNSAFLSALSAYLSKFVIKATTPHKAAKELPLVAFSSLWLCASAHKAFRFRRGVGEFIHSRYL
jgi:hypothetical protein